MADGFNFNAWQQQMQGALGSNGAGGDFPNILAALLGLKASTVNGLFSDANGLFSGLASTQAQGNMWISGQANKYEAGWKKGADVLFGQPASPSSPMSTPSVGSSGDSEITV